MNERNYKIYATICQIPAGKVATYGQVAKNAGLITQARQVGNVLAGLPPGSEIPWHRVVNCKGEIRTNSILNGENLQRQLLEKDGVYFNSHGRISLKLYAWLP